MKLHTNCIVSLSCAVFLSGLIPSVLPPSAIAKTKTTGASAQSAKEAKTAAFFETIHRLEKARPFSKKSIEDALNTKMQIQDAGTISATIPDQTLISAAKVFTDDKNTGPVILMMDDHNTLKSTDITKHFAENFQSKFKLGYANPTLTRATKGLVFDDKAGFVEFEFLASAPENLSRVVISGQPYKAEEAGTDKDLERLNAKLQSIMKGLPNWSKDAPNVVDENLFDGCSGEMSSRVSPYAFVVQAIAYYGQDGKTTSFRLQLNRNCKISVADLTTKYGKATSISKSDYDKKNKYRTYTFVVSKDGKQFELTFEYAQDDKEKIHPISVMVLEHSADSVQK